MSKGITKIVIGGAASNPVVGVAVTGGVLVGGYYLLTKLIPGWNPLGDSWNGVVEWFKHPFQNVAGMFTFSKDSGKHGEVIGLSATGLIPNSVVKYGWKPNFLLGFGGFEAPVEVQSNGEITFSFVIADDTPTGKYLIYLDQRDYGGAYGERAFTVLEGHV